MSEGIWSVPATVIEVVNGDTLRLQLDLGWRISYEIDCKLAGLFAAPIETDEGRAARSWLIKKLIDAGAHPRSSDSPQPVTLISHGLDERGRSLGQIVVSTPQGATFELGSALLDAGLADPWSDPDRE